MVSDWHRFIENSVYEKAKSNPDYKIVDVAEIHKINDKKHRYEKVGTASVTLDNTNFIIDGTIYGEKFYKQVFARNFPMLPCVPSKRFEIQDGNDIFRVYPKEPKKVMEFINYVKALFRINFENHNKD